jgi:ribosomal protein L22
MASSSDSSVSDQFQLLKKVENKQKCLEFFKSIEIKKTLQMHGWQKHKTCKKCD